MLLGLAPGLSIKACSPLLVKDDAGETLAKVSCISLARPVSLGDDRQFPGFLIKAGVLQCYCNLSPKV